MKLRFIPSTLLSGLAGVVLATATVTAGANEGNVRRISSANQDGPFQYHRVMCKNRTKGTVVVRNEKNDVCAQAFRGELICRQGWTVKAAAQVACG